MNYDNIISGTDNWNPRQFFEPIAAPEEVKKNSNSLSWKACDYAICYIVFQNDSVIDITTECTSTIDAGQDAECFSVKAVNEYGSLGERAIAQDGTSGINEITPEISRPDFVAIGGNGSLEILVQKKLTVTVHNAAGQLVKQIEYTPGVYFIENLPAGLYLVNDQKVIVK